MIIIVLDEMNFIWREKELLEIIEMWEQEFSVKYMADYFDRDPDEVFIALLHLGRKRKITQRKGGIFGSE